MGRIITIPLLAATTRSWTVDADTLLISLMASVSGANGVSVSTDPSLTGAILLATPGTVTSILSGLIGLVVPNSAGFSQNLRTPLAKGMVLYLNSTAATWLFLLVEDILPAI